VRVRARARVRVRVKARVRVRVRVKGEPTYLHALGSFVVYTPAAAPPARIALICAMNHSGAHKCGARGVVMEG
jgi:hypothetical protein